MIPHLWVLPVQLPFTVKTWSGRAGDVRLVSRLVTFGLPALAFYEAAPHPSVDMREQFADLFTVLQARLHADRWPAVCTKGSGPC